jgi:hypothetical protein
MRCLTALPFLIIAGCSAAPSELRKETTNNVQNVVIDHIKRHLDDTDGFEIVEWGQPEQVKVRNGGRDVPATAIAVSYRSKNRFGAKVLNREQYYVRDGKVVEDYAKPAEIEEEPEEPLYTQIRKKR